MNAIRKAEDRLIQELEELRRRIAELEKSEIECQQAEEVIQRNLQFRQLLLDTIPSPIFYKDVKGVYLGGNKALEGLWGLSLDQIVGKTVYGISPPDLADIYERADQELFNSPGVQTYETSLLSSNGTRHNVIFNKATFTDGEGKVAGLIGVIVDITERKRAEDALRESEKKYRLIADNSNDWIYLINPDGNFQYVSPSSERLTGYHYLEFINNPDLFLDIIHPDDQELVKSHLKIIREETEAHNLEFRLITKEGELRWIRHSCLPVYNDQSQYVGRSGTNRDITVRKRAEKELQESRNHHKSLMESATNFAVYRLVHDKENPYKLNMVFASPSLKEILGLSDPLRFESFFEAMHPDDKERIVAANLRAFETLKFNESYRFFHPVKNEWRWVHAISSGVLDEDQTTRYVNGILIDITDKKKAEEALLEAYDTLEQKIRERTSDLRIANEKLQRQIAERKGVEETLRKSEERLKYLADRLIDAQENERKRIAFELHDELGQSLVGLKFQLSGLQKRSTGTSDDFTLELTQAINALNGMTENVRRLSRELRPSVLEHLGLLEALHWLFEDFTGKYRIKVLNSVNKIKKTFSKEQEIIVFRIFQEALANIGKHAKATQVTISMADEGKWTIFSIRDNGKGFNLKEVKGKNLLRTGLGLIAMQERAMMAGGTIEIKSEPGKGTMITFAIQGRRTGKK
jgi:PAS domain S-box-containing protein